jgi:purine nucleosidase
MTRIAGLAVRARCRVVLDNDWSGDPDGLVALAHHLLSPANRVVAVTSSFLNPRFPASESKAADGAAVAAELLDQLALPVQPVVYAGRSSRLPRAPPLPRPRTRSWSRLAGRMVCRCTSRAEVR